MTNIEKLRSISTPAEEDWFKIAEEWDKEDVYIEKSTKIALSVLSILRERKMTKQALAEKMGVSAQYVSKIVKGNENLTLETISKLEAALDVELVSVTEPKYVVSATTTAKIKELFWDKIFSAHCYSGVAQESALEYANFPERPVGQIELAFS